MVCRQKKKAFPREWFYTKALQVYSAGLYPFTSLLHDSPFTLIMPIMELAPFFEPFFKHIEESRLCYNSSWDHQYSSPSKLVLDVLLTPLQRQVFLVFL